MVFGNVMVNRGRHRQPVARSKLPFFSNLFNHNMESSGVISVLDRVHRVDLLTELDVVLYGLLDIS